MNEAYSPSTCPTLRRGARGNAVAKMQRDLVRHYKDLDEDSFVDGNFGPVTEQQVKRFQRQQRLKVDGVVGRNTWTALLQQPGERVKSPVGQTASTEDRLQASGEAGTANGGGSLAERVQRTLQRKGYKFLDDGQPYHLNIVGVRNPSTKINSFDDRIVLVYRDESGRQQALQYSITTDPGEVYTRHRLLNKNGAAILMPGQYNAYRVGKHRGKYDALIQAEGQVKVWRDSNRDDQLNRSGKEYKGWFGINIHRAKAEGTTKRIGPYSAGCQVFQNADDFSVLMGLTQKSRGRRGNRFTYTLIEEADLK